MSDLSDEELGNMDRVAAHWHDKGDGVMRDMCRTIASLIAEVRRHRAREVLSGEDERAAIEWAIIVIKERPAEHPVERARDAEVLPILRALMMHRKEPAE